MNDPLAILQEYVAAYRSGEPADPLGYLARLEGDRREELADLMEAFHLQAGRRPFDARAFERSPARAVSEEATRTVLGASGLWPTLLPRLRMRAKVSRAELVRRLASDLGVPEQEEQVRAYYHEMELGSLPASGVQDRVLAALADIVGETAEALREAGRAIAPSSGASPGAPGAAPAFARLAAPDPDFQVAAGAASGSPDPEGDRAGEVDELFLGRVET